MKFRNAIAALALFLSETLLADGSIAVDHAWARETPPGVTNGAAYMRIHNRTDKPDRLVSVSSRRAARGELHTSFEDDGVMKMRPREAIELSAGGQAVLEPGADHVMLLDLDGPLKDGEYVDLELTFEGAGVLRIEVPVRRHTDAQDGHTHSSD